MIRLWVLLWVAATSAWSNGAHACSEADPDPVLYPRNGSRVAQDFVVIIDNNDASIWSRDQELVWVSEDDGSVVSVVVDDRGRRTFLSAERPLPPGRHHLHEVGEDEELLPSPFADLVRPLSDVVVQDRLAVTLAPPDVSVVHQGNNGLAFPGPCSGGNRAWVRFSLSDDDGVGVVVAQTERADFDLVDMDPNAAPDGTLLTWTPWGAPGKAFVVGTYDEAGRFSGWSDPVQVWLPPPNFCRCVSTSPTSGAVGAVVVALLLGLCRRRQR